MIRAKAILAAALACALASPSLEAVRGRVQVVQNGAWDSSGNRYDPEAPGRTVVTDQGSLLRGAAFWAVTYHSWSVKYAQQRSSWEVLKENGFNLVRLSLNNFEPDKYGDSIVFTNEAWLAQIDQWVDWAEELGLYVILDHHEIGGHTQEWLRKFWTEVAPRYRHRAHVIYELANEPVGWRPNQYTAQDIADQQEIYDLIRSYAPETHIIVLTFAIPDPGMNEVARQLDVDWTNTSVGFHGYWTTNASEVDRLKREFPVFNTEFGSAMDNFDGSKNHRLGGYEWQTELMEKWKISWAVWDANYRSEKVAQVLLPLVAHARDNGYMWEIDDYKANGLETRLEDWIYVTRTGYLYAPEYGWMYPLEGTGWKWLYNFADDTWRMAE